MLTVNVNQSTLENETLNQLLIFKVIIPRRLLHSHIVITVLSINLTGNTITSR